MRVRYTKLALADIGEAQAYMARNEPAAAAQVIARVRAAVATLAEHPELGRSGRLHGTRELVVSRTPFVVPYRIVDGTIEILAVIHGRRAWPTSL